MLTPKQESLNNIVVKYWALLVLFSTGVLSILLYKQRVIYVDSALQVFEMINLNTFSIYVERYSMILSQLLPVMLIKSDAPLYAILMSYSFSGVLIHFICFILCFYVFKNKESVIFLVSFIIMYRHAYFHSISETYYSIAYSALFYACINYLMTIPRSSKLLFYFIYLISFILIVLNYFIHPITFFLLSFAVCFTALNLKTYKAPELYILLLLIGLVFISKFLFSSNQHENNYFSQLKGSNLLNTIIHSHSLGFFIVSIKNIFLFPSILLLLTIILYAIEKQYLALTLIIGMILFFITVTAITFNKGESILVLETRIAPLYFFICIPLFNILLKKPILFYLTLTLLSYQIIITFISLNKIGKSVFQKRLDTLTSPFKNHTGKKLLVYDRTIKTDTDLLVTWGCSIETLLYTSIEGKEHSKTLFISNEDPTINNPSNKEEGLFMFVPWWQYYAAEKLNNKYFNVSNEPYEIIDSLE